MPDTSDLVADLFAREIPEIATGTIQIKAIARRPGVRSKVALYSQDPRLDCIGVCVGIRGFHIKNLVDKLGYERIDLVRWNESTEQLIVNALQPAAIERVTLQPAEHRAVVVVNHDQISLVLGREGQNLELASQLSGWQIEVKEA